MGDSKQDVAAAGPKVRLSVAIITLNEERNLADCLASVQGLAEEIVVLDSGSTDRTREIALSFPNVRFETHRFDGHIEQKNRALALCRGEWILAIDADERVTPELAASIRAFLAANRGAVGARFPRRTWHSGAFVMHGGWYPNARPRLIRAGHGRWGGENPHDVLLVDGPVATLRGDLLHYTCRDLADHVHTVNQFSSIVALTRFNARRRFSLLRLLVMPCWKLVEIYLIKRGFLDGIRGLHIAVTSAFSAYLKEAKLYELDRLGLPKPSNLGDRYDKLR